MEPFLFFVMQILPLVIVIAIVTYLVVALRRIADAVDDVRADVRRISERMPG